MIILVVYFRPVQNGIHLRPIVPFHRRPLIIFPRLPSRGLGAGDHFGTSGAPWRTKGAAGWTRGAREQDFHRFGADFGTLWLRVFLAPRLEIPIVCRACFQVEIWRLGALNSRFSHGKYCKKQFITEIVFRNSGVYFCCFWIVPNTS